MSSGRLGVVISTPTIGATAVRGHGGATLLTLSNYPLQVRLRTRNVSRGVLYRSQDACDSVECDVHR